MIPFASVMDENKPQMQWPLRPMSVEWRRGPAWIDGEDIVIDLARSTTYHPFADRRSGWSWRGCGRPTTLSLSSSASGSLTTPIHVGDNR